MDESTTDTKKMGSGVGNDNDCNDGQKYRIAIVGASYAGLTLANVLERVSKGSNNSVISYSIFDGKSMPFTYIVGGKEFDVPFYHTVLVPQLWKLDGCSNKGAVTRKEVSEQLFKNIKKECLFTQTKIINIVEKQIEDDSSSKVVFYLHGSSSNNNNNNTVYGPYDAVVGSDGVRSLVRPYGKKGIYVIGDARWVESRWYDFGTKRIQEGANIAMTDAYNFGHQLLNNHHPTIIRIDNQYCTYEIQKQMNQQKQRILFIFVILISILYYNTYYSQ